MTTCGRSWHVHKLKGVVWHSYLDHVHHKLQCMYNAGGSRYPSKGPDDVTKTTKCFMRLSHVVIINSLFVHRLYTSDRQIQELWYRTHPNLFGWKTNLTHDRDGLLIWWTFFVIVFLDETVIHCLYKNIDYSYSNHWLQFPDWPVMQLLGSIVSGCFPYVKLISNTDGGLFSEHKIALINIATKIWWKMIALYAF